MPTVLWQWFRLDDDDGQREALAEGVSAILALARTAPGGGPREPTKDGWDAAEAIIEWPDLALRRAAYTCARPFDVAESTPAYISFGKYTMDTDGLHTELKRGRRGNSFEIVRCPRRSKFWGMGAIRVGGPGDDFSAGAIRTVACIKNSSLTKHCKATLRRFARHSRPTGCKSSGTSNANLLITFRVCKRIGA